jgi:hypothetical protein
MAKSKRVGIGKWVVAVGLGAAIVMAGCASAAPQASFSDNSAPAAGAAEAPRADAVAQADGNPTTDVASSNRKIIARAGLTLVVVDTEATVDAITALMDELGGYVST